MVPPELPFSPELLPRSSLTNLNRLRNTFHTMYQPRTKEYQNELTNNFFNQGVENVIKFSNVTSCGVIMLYLSALTIKP